MKKMMVSCEKASFLASKSQDEKLSCKENLNMHLHLAGCHICRRYKKDIDLMSRKIREYRSITENESYQLKLTEEQKKRIREKIHSTGA
jgi:hypothetical protein